MAAGQATEVATRATGCRAAVLEVAAELAARDQAGLIRSRELVTEVVVRSGFAKSTVTLTVGQMAGRRDPGCWAYNDLERVQQGVYRLRPSAGQSSPRRPSARTEVLAAVERICATSPDGTASVDEVRQALAGIELQQRHRHPGSTAAHDRRARCLAGARRG